MRLALACPYAWDDAGGVQVHVAELMERLRGRGHEVVVLAPVRGAVDAPGVIAIGKPVDVPYNDSNAPIDPRPWSRGPVRGALATFGPDLVHAHQPTAPSTGMWATMEAHVPVVGTFHSGATRSRLYDVAAPLVRRVSRRLAARIAVSERAAAFERSRIGGSFHVIPNGVDVERFRTARPREDLPDGRRLLFVGRLDERKGFAVAVDAFAMLAERDADAVLVVAGDGPARDAVQRLRPAVRERVVLLGHVLNPELPPVHAACDLYLGPATGGESFGVVLLEAMAAGLPVVASDTPGYDEVIRDGLDGLLVPPRDAGALAAAAARVLEDPSLAARLTAGGRERVALFDWATVVERIEAVYVQALASGPSVR